MKNKIYTREELEALDFNHLLNTFLLINDQLVARDEQNKRHNKQIADLKFRLEKAEIKNKKALESIRKAGFIIQGKGSPAETYLTEANNYLI